MIEQIPLLQSGTFVEEFDVRALLNANFPIAYAFGVKQGDYVVYYFVDEQGRVQSMKYYNKERMCIDFRGVNLSSIQVEKLKLYAHLTLARASEMCLSPDFRVPAREVQMKKDLFQDCVAESARLKSSVTAESRSMRLQHEEFASKLTDLLIHFAPAEAASEIYPRVKDSIYFREGGTAWVPCFNLSDFSKWYYQNAVADPT